MVKAHADAIHFFELCVSDIVYSCIMIMMVMVVYYDDDGYGGVNDDDEKLTLMRLKMIMAKLFSYKGKGAEFFFGK